MTGHFEEQETQMANKYMKKGSAPLTIIIKIHVKMQ